MRRRLSGEQKERHKNLRKREAAWFPSKSDKVGRRR